MSLRDRSMRTDYDGGGTTGSTAGATLPNPSVASAAAAGWNQATDALTFSINENLALYRACRENDDWSSAISHLEGAAISALKLGDVVIKQVAIEPEPTFDDKIDVADLITFLRGMGLAWELPPEPKPAPTTEPIPDSDIPDPDLDTIPSPDPRDWYRMHESFKKDFKDGC